MTRYEETVPAPRWLIGVVLVAAIGMLLALALLYRSEEAISVRVAMTLVLGLSAALMIWIARVFANLQITVSDDVVSFGFGPIVKRLEPAEVVAALPERYPWVRYGGWGVRVSRGGYRAYSQAFRRESVRIDAADEHHYHVTSSRPAELASAINKLAQAGSSRA